MLEQASQARYGSGPTTSEYNIMDLDIPEAKSRVEIKAREGESIEAAHALYTMSQYHRSSSSVVNRMTFSQVIQASTMWDFHFM
jgi:hypothetical protein